MTEYTAPFPVDAVDQLPFSPAEYDSRLAACRRAMADRNLDYLVLNTPENIYYLSGFITRGYYALQALIVTLTENPVLVVRRYEKANVDRLSYYQKVSVWEENDVPVDVLAGTLAELGAEKATIGIDGDSCFFTVSAYDRLRGLLRGAVFVNGSTVLAAIRAVKSPQELTYIRRAAVARNAAFKAAREMARPGRTENEVAAAFNQAAILAGSGYESGSAYVASGPRMALPHATWSSRRIEKGDLIQVSGAANFKRYCAVMMRTWSMGKPKDGIRRTADASIAALEAAIATIKPGVTGADVDAACRDAATNAGFPNAFGHRIGYSVGLGICPSWLEESVMDIKRGSTRQLEPGMVLHVAPVLFPQPDVSVGFSAMVAVTDTGCELICDYSNEMEL